MCNFREHYTKIDKLGQGGFGEVYSGFHNRTEMPCAIKVIDKYGLDSARKHELNKNEFEIVEEIFHPHVVRVFELMEDKRNYYIIMELMKGGHLFTKLIE